MTASKASHWVLAMLFQSAGESSGGGWTPRIVTIAAASDVAGLAHGEERGDLAFDDGDAFVDAVVDLWLCLAEHGGDGPADVSARVRLDRAGSLEQRFGEGVVGVDGVTGREVVVGDPVVADRGLDDGEITDGDVGPESSGGVEDHESFRPAEGDLVLDLADERGSRAHATDRYGWIVDGDEVAPVADCHRSVLDETRIIGEPVGVDGLKDEHQRCREPSRHPSVAFGPVEERRRVVRRRGEVLVGAWRARHRSGPGTRRQHRTAETRPGCKPVLAGDHELCVGQPGIGVPIEACQRTVIAMTGIGEQVLRLTFQLVEIGPSRQRSGDGSGC